jgi:hypothetical protein
MAGIAVHLDPAGRAALAAAAADRHRDVLRFAAAERAGQREPAVAAAVAGALGADAVGALALGIDIAAVVDAHCLAGAAVAAAAADADAGVVLAEHDARDAEAALAAAAADALAEDRAGVVALRPDVAGVVHLDLVRIAAERRRSRRCSAMP